MRGRLLWWLVVLSLAGIHSAARAQCGLTISNGSAWSETSDPNGYYIMHWPMRVDTAVTVHFYWYARPHVASGDPPAWVLVDNGTYSYSPGSYENTLRRPYPFDGITEELALDWTVAGCPDVGDVHQVVSVAPHLRVTGYWSPPVALGGTAMIQATVEEGLGVYSYTSQWLRDGNPVNLADPRIFAAGNYLQIQGVSQADAGGYSIVVSDGYGSATSGPIPLPLDPCTGVWDVGDLVATDSLDTGFGTAIAGGNGVLFVGAPGDSSHAGAVYEFVRSADGWTVRARLTASDGTPGNLFGQSVALDFDTLLIGAPGSLTTAGAGAGAVYVYRQTGPTWVETGKLVASDGAPGDQFGYAVTLNTRVGALLVGAPYCDAPGRLDAGAAYWFSQDGLLDWMQADKLVVGTNAGDHAGSTVAIAVICSPVFFIGAPDSSAGYVWMFAWEGEGSWQQRLLVGEAAGDRFGCSMAAYGSGVMIGAESADAPGALRAGAVYDCEAVDCGDPVFSVSSKLTAPAPEAGARFGASVGVSTFGPLIVSAPGTDTERGADSGAAYIYSYSLSARWVPQASVIPSHSQAGEAAGSAVMVDEDGSMYIGAPHHVTQEGADTGAVFELAFGTGGTWVEPAAAIACPQEAATFTAHTVGPGPFSYRWLFNNVPLSEGANHEGGFTINASGTSSPALTVQVSPSNFFRLTFSCTVTNGCGELAGRAFGDMYVQASTWVVAEAAHLCAGEPFRLLIDDSGTFRFSPASVQWRHNGIEIPGASGWTYEGVASGADSGMYDVVFTQGACAWTSEPFVLAVSSPDFNGDGDLGTDMDIEAFFACLGGNCCPTCGSADFNGDGDLGTDADIESFFRVLAGGVC